MVQINPQKKSSSSLSSSSITVYHGIGFFLTLVMLCMVMYSLSSLTQLNTGHHAAQIRLGTVLGAAASSISSRGNGEPFTARPYLVYGTAWKKEETARLVQKAVETGFRHIDTACQPKHYDEAGVGKGWTDAVRNLPGLSRKDLYLQTKYTPIDGQDREKPLPYNPADSLEETVRQSLESSLRNLRTEYLDAWVLHSPLRSYDDTLRVWRVFEEAVDAGVVRRLGISNCYDLTTLARLYTDAAVKPSVVQNRFYDRSNFDVGLRNFCNDRGIVYQSFWTLTANRRALASRPLKHLADEVGLTPQTLMYAFMMTLGHTPLSGTTNELHMAEDVAVMERMAKGLDDGAQVLNEEQMKLMSDVLGIPHTA